MELYDWPEKCDFVFRLAAVMPVWIFDWPEKAVARQSDQRRDFAQARRERKRIGVRGGAVLARAAFVSTRDGGGCSYTRGPRPEPPLTLALRPQRNRTERAAFRGLRGVEL